MGIGRAIVTLLLVWSGANILGATAVDRAQTELLTQRIQARFEAALYMLKPEVQDHYALRMYRITGDDAYVYPIAFNYLLMAGRLGRDIDNRANDNYIDGRTDQILGDYEGGGRKNSARKEMFQKYHHLPFFLNLLYTCARLSDYRLTDSQTVSLLSRTIESLRTIDFRSFLLDQGVIRVFAAQAVNHVFYLNELGIVDIRREYEKAFRRAFPEKDDEFLSNLEFKDKIYGMTHFILAASGYYQHTVDSAEYGWILTYFDKLRNRIFKETKPDIIAEVGLCYLLCGRADDSMVTHCREAVIAAVDTVTGTILSPADDDDLEKGEHRNVLAIMLLRWPATLHPGPYLEASPRYRKMFAVPPGNSR